MLRGIMATAEARGNALVATPRRQTPCLKALRVIMGARCYAYPRGEIAEFLASSDGGHRAMRCPREASTVAESDFRKPSSLILATRAGVPDSVSQSIGLTFPCSAAISHVGVAAALVLTSLPERSGRVSQR